MTLEELQNNIQSEIADLLVDMFERVVRNFRNRLNQYIAKEGDFHEIFLKRKTKSLM